MNVVETILSPEVLALLEASDLPATDLREGRQAKFLAAVDDGRILGCVAYELGGEVALLRSLAVRSGARGKGIGRLLVAEAERQARADGVDEMFLLTTTAAPYFESLGFAKVARDLAPNFVAESQQFLGLCPGSALLMRRRL